MNTLIFVEQLFKQQYVVPRQVPDIRNTWINVPEIPIVSVSDYFSIDRLQPDIANKQTLGTVVETELTEINYENISVKIFEKDLGRQPLISILGEHKETKFPGANIAVFLYEKPEEAIALHPWLAEGNLHILAGSQICGYGKHWYMLHTRYHSVFKKFHFGFSWIGGTLGTNDMHIMC